MPGGPFDPAAARGEASTVGTHADRRDVTPSGRQRRAEFARTVEALRGVGLPKAVLDQAVKILRQRGPRLSRALVEVGVLTERQFAQAIAQRWGLAYTELGDEGVDPEAARLVPGTLAQRHSLVAVARRQDRLVVAMSDPSNVVAIDDIRLLTGLETEIIIASPDNITRAQSRLYGIAADLEQLLKTSTPAVDSEVIESPTQDEEITVEHLRSMVEKAPIVRVVNQVIQQAVQAGASDIHLEPRRHDVRVRFRIDGLLRDIMAPPKEIQAALVSRLKILANIDIAERRLPQDGHIHMRVDGKAYDFRVSTLPTVLGENVVIRILDQSSTKASMNQIGMPGDLLAAWESLVTKPYGLIVVTGPTGSGKTTTLYTSLARINTPDRSVVSVEDPVEYQMPGVKQMQVNSRIGLTFASGLRSILRQDPDIVLIGEIRDRETAQIAVQASMTGHLVLTTLHTNDAAGVPTRLQDMGTEPFLVTASLIGVLAQRLLRVICAHCKEAYTPPAEALRRIGLDPAQHRGLQLYRGLGCNHCHGTGYRGRIGVFELLVMTDDLRALTLRGASGQQIRDAAQDKGMRLMWQDGVQKVLKGTTTMEELLRVVFASEEESLPAE